MKSGMEFGSLTKNYLTTQSRKDTGQHEVVLNNQQMVPATPLECIGSSAYPSHICFADIHENVIPMPYSKSTVIGTERPTGRELRQKVPLETSQNCPIPAMACHPQQNIINLTTRSTQIQQPHPPVIHFKEHPCTRANIDFQQPRNIFPRKRKEASRRNWLTRASILIAVVLVTTCIVYQICAWTGKWQKRRSFLILQRVPCEGGSIRSDYQTDLQQTNQAFRNRRRSDDANLVNFTICNANPFRGSAIFELPSGSYLYDALTGLRTGTMQIPEFAKELSKQSLKTVLELSHQLSEMLKSCLINGMPCEPEQFESVLNANRLCFRLSLNSSARELRLLLDPEEFDYLLPNEALIGFYLAVDNPKDQPITPLAGIKSDERSIDILQPLEDSDDHFVGSQFQTFIQIGFSDTYLRAVVNSLENPDKVAKIYRPVIRSVVQAVKPAFSSRLLQLKKPTDSRSPSNAAKARLVQQWAYIRLENRSSAVAIENLALRLGNLKKDFDGMTQALGELQKAQHAYPKDVVSRPEYIETCFSQSSTSVLNEIVNFTNNFHEDLCRLIESNDHSLLLSSIRCASTSLKHKNRETNLKQKGPISAVRETGSSLQLSVVQMLFLQPFRLNQQINQMLRRQVNLLSLVNQGIQLSPGATTSVETLVCTSCERLTSSHAGSNQTGMTCRRLERQVGIDVSRHHALFKVFNQAIAACTQRLDSLMRDLENVRVANDKYIQSFRKLRGQGMGETSSSSTNSLVSLRIRINAEEIPIYAEFASLDDIASSVSELLGILTSGLAGILALITLWRVLEMKRAQRIVTEQESNINTAKETEHPLTYFKTASGTSATT